jgi:hypothetical protein
VEGGKVINPAAWMQARRAGGGGPVGLVRKLVVLAFAVIQLILVARVLLDLGLIPAEGAALELLVPWSDALAAPVAGLGDGLGGLLGGGIPGLGGLPGTGQAFGGGLNPVMLAALAGWTIVEALVLRVVGKFAAV